MRRTIITLSMATMAAFPIGSAWGAAHAPQVTTKKAKPKPTLTPTATSVPKKATTKKIKGPVVDMRWGPVQVTVVVKNKKLMDVKTSVSPDTNRSQFIDANSVPVLRQEALQAQSSQIDTVSGATLTSEAFIQSLHDALVKANFKNP